MLIATEHVALGLMNPEQIQSLCIAGTDAYLAFLVENNRGLDRIRVIERETLSSQPSPIVKLKLGTRLIDPECISLELRPPGKIFGPDFFRIVEYDTDAKVLVVEVLDTELPLETAPPNAISVVSDLRFLVQNVKR